MLLIRIVAVIWCSVLPATAADQLAAAQPSAKFEALGHSKSQATWRLSSGFDVASGDYGAQRATTLSYAPMGLSYSKGLWTFSVDTGYIDVTGPASFVDIADLGFTADDAKALGLDENFSAQGFDNISLSARVAAFDLWRQNLFIDFTGKVLVPTASRTKGLGTGAFDSALSIDATKLTGRTTWFATVGYKFRGGDSSRRNSWSAGYGFSRALGHGVSTGLSYDLRQTGIRGGPFTHELTAFLSLGLARSSSVTVYGLIGRPTDHTGAGVGVRFSHGF
jgi:hypothetical protein